MMNIYDRKYELDTYNFDSKFYQIMMYYMMNYDSTIQTSHINISKLLNFI